MDPVSSFNQLVLKRVVAHLCLSLGFNSVNSDVLGILTDLLKVYIMEIGRRSHLYSEMYQRVETNLNDVQQTFADFNVNVQEIIDYMRGVEPGSLAIDVPSFPAVHKPTDNIIDLESLPVDASKENNEDGVARQASQTSIGGQALDQVSSDRRPSTTVPIEGASPLKRMRNWPEEALPVEHKWVAFDRMEDGTFKPNRLPKPVKTGPRPPKVPPLPPIKEALSPIIEASKHYNSPPQHSFNLPQPRKDLPMDNHAFNKKMKSLTKQKKLLKDKMFKDKSSKDKSFKDKSFKDKSYKDKSLKDKSLKQKSLKDMTLPVKTFKEKIPKEKTVKEENLDGFPKHKSSTLKTKKPKKIPKSRSLILDDIGFDGEENDNIDVGDPFCMPVKSEMHDDAFSQDANYSGAKQTRMSSYIDTIDSVIKNGQASEVSELDYGIDIVNDEMVAEEADREDNSPSIDRFNFDCSNDLSRSKQQEKAERAARISDTINMVAESSFDPLDLNSNDVVSGHMVEEECVEEILPWSDEEPMEPFHASPKQKSIPSASLQFSDVEDIKGKQKSDNQNQQITGLEMILQEKLADELSDSSEILNDTASAINRVASPIWSKAASPLDEKLHSPSFYSLPARVEFDDMAQPPLKRIRISGIGKEELSIKEHNRGHGIIDLGESSERSHKKDKKDKKDKKKSKKHKDKDGDSLKDREKKKSKHKDHDSKREDREKHKHSKEEKHRRKEEKHRSKEQDGGRKLVDDEKERHRLEKERHKEEKLRKQLEEERQRELEKKKQQEEKEKQRIENELRMERERKLEEEKKAEKERERLRLEELERKRLEELEKERRREEAERARREELERERAIAEKERLRAEREEKDRQKEERERKKHREEKAKRREEKEKMKLEKEKKKEEEKERLRLECENEKRLNDEKEKQKEMKEKLKEKTGKESKKKSLEEKVEELKREKMLSTSKPDQKKHRKNEDKPSEEKSEKIPKLTLKFGGATVCGMPSTSISALESSSSSNSPSLPVPAPLKIVINKTSFSNSPSSVVANPSPKHVPKAVASTKKSSSSDRLKSHVPRSPSPSSKRKFNASPAVSDFSSSPDRDSFSIPSIASSRSSSPKFPMVKNTPPPPSLSIHTLIPTKKSLPTSRLLLSAESPSGSPSPPLLSQTPYNEPPSTLSKSKKSAAVSKKSDRQQSSVLSTPISIFPTTSTSGKGRGKKLPAIVTETVGKIQKDDGEIIWICPICKLQDDGSPMIGCDNCDDWYHWPCVNIFKEPPEHESWYCPRCSKDSSSKKGKSPAAASAKKGRGKKGKNK